MSDLIPKDTAISTEAYHTLAFRGQSADVLARTIREIGLIGGRKRLYPLSNLPTWREPVLEDAFSVAPQSDIDVPLTLAEAAALKTVIDEASAIGQNFDRDFEATKKTLEVTEVEGSATDFLQGMNDFASCLIAASKRRDEIRNSWKAPSWEDQVNVHILTDAVKSDGLSLGNHTIAACVELAMKNSVSRVKAFTDEVLGVDVPTRIRDCNRGIDQAAMIYREVFDIARSRGLADRLE